MDVKRPKAFKFYKTKRKWNNAHKKYLIECTVNSVSIGCMWKKKNSAEANKKNIEQKKWEAIYVKWIIKTEIISLKSEIRVLWMLENILASKFDWVSLGIRTVPYIDERRFLDLHHAIITKTVQSSGKKRKNNGEKIRISLNYDASSYIWLKFLERSGVECFCMLKIARSFMFLNRIIENISHSISLKCWI